MKFCFLNRFFIQLLFLICFFLKSVQIASGGNFGNHTYRIVAGRSKSLTGTFVDKQGKPMTEGFATTLLQSTESDTFSREMD